MSELNEIGGPLVDVRELEKWQWENNTLFGIARGRQHLSDTLLLLLA